MKGQPAPRPVARASFACAAVQIARLHVSPEGVPVLSPTNLRLRAAGRTGPASSPEAATHVHVRELLAGAEAWGGLPARAYVVVLDGALAAAGTRLGAGEALLVEGPVGTHGLSAAGEALCRVLVVELPELAAPDVVEVASDESFPASDPPGWTEVVST